MPHFVFDQFAREAVASLRTPPPPGGATAAMKAATRQRARRAGVGIASASVLVIGGLVVLAARDDGKERQSGDTIAVSVDATIPGTTQAPTSTASATTSAAATPDSTTAAGVEQSAGGWQQWLAAYVDGTTAVPAGDPIRIGIYKPGEFADEPLDIATEYVNTELGGASGRPLELVKCSDTEQACAETFASDSIVLAVIEDQHSSSIGDELAGRTALLSPAPIVGTQGVSFYPGMHEDLNAMSIKAAEILATDSDPKIIAIDQLSGRLPGIVADIFPAAEVVEASDVAGLVSLISDAGALDADAVILNAFYTECPVVKAALDELGMSPIVIANVCDPIDGWYQPDLGFNLSDPDLDSGGLAMTELLASAGFVPTTDGPGLQDAVVFTARFPAGLFTIVKLINELGPDATAQNLDTAMRSFTGPIALGAGPLDCDPAAVPPQRRMTGSCVQFVDLYQAVDGAWIPQTPVDLRTPSRS